MAGTMVGHSFGFVGGNFRDMGIGLNLIYQVLSVLLLLGGFILFIVRPKFNED